MKIFLRQLFIFSLPVISLIVFFEIYLRNTDSVYSLKERGLIENANKIEILILGNSHSTYGIAPAQFNSYAYNMAQVNQSLYFDKRLTLKHIDKLPRLKFVLISIDYHSLYFSSQGMRDAWSYYGNGIVYKDKLPFFEKYSYIKGYTPKLAVYSFINNFSHKKAKLNAIDLDNKGVNTDQPIVKGWFSLNGISKSEMETNSYKIRANSFEQTIFNSKEKDEILSDVEDFIRKLKNKNIIPILITTPCYSLYVNMFNKIQLEKNDAEVTNLAKKYDIRYWNDLNLPLPTTYFFNSDHLNTEGAKNYSAILNGRIENLRNQIN